MLIKYSFRRIETKHNVLSKVKSYAYNISLINCYRMHLAPNKLYPNFTSMKKKVIISEYDYGWEHDHEIFLIRKFTRNKYNITCFRHKYRKYFYLFSNIEKLGRIKLYKQKIMNILVIIIT